MRRARNQRSTNANGLLYAKENSVRFIRMKSEGIIFTTVINVVDAVRGVLVSQSLFSNFYLGSIQVRIGSTFPAVSHIFIEDSSLVKVNFEIETRSQYSLGYLWLRNSTLHNSMVSSSHENNEGALACSVENCTLSSGLVFENLVYLSVHHSRFIDIDESKCIRGCAMHVEKPPSEKLSRRIFDYFMVTSPTVKIEHVTFEGSSASERGGAILCKDVNLTISNVVFRMTPQSSPPSEGGFIYYEADYFKEYKLLAKHIIFDVSRFSQAVAPNSLKAFGIVDFTNVTLLCPPALKAVDKVQGIGFYLLCEIGCPPEYSFDACNMTMYGKLDNRFVRTDWSGKRAGPLCHPCPVGANCDSHIKALPNYWGYVTQDNEVTMLRCPPGYCCQCNDTCEGFDSCNTGRTGTLCGSCEENLTESLFSPTCFPVTECHDALILGGYGLCVIAYAIVLIVTEPLKNKVLNLFKKASKVLKSRKSTKEQNLSKQNLSCDVLEGTIEVTIAESTVEVDDTSTKTSRTASVICHESEGSKSRHSKLDKENRKRNAADSSTEESRRKSKLSSEVSLPTSQESSSKEGKSDSGMKYIQILLYYVQDASLFKVNLPETGTGQSEGVIVQILQFSPDVLTSIFTEVTELCLKYGLTPVTKVFSKLFFGPCVMLFLFLIYLTQKLISHFVFKDSAFWKSLKSCLVQAFLLALLFSYQKLLIGTFTLVQCVDVGEKQVLYIEGDIECGAIWWQVLTQVYIYSSIIPLSFVLSYTPFLVQDKTMAVRLFILACLLPLPVMGYIAGKMLFKCRRTGNTTQDGNGSGDIELFILRDDNKKVSIEQGEDSEVSLKTYTGPKDVVIPFMDEDSDDQEKYIAQIRKKTSQTEVKSEATLKKINSEANKIKASNTEHPLRQATSTKSETHDIQGTESVATENEATKNNTVSSKSEATQTQSSESENTPTKIEASENEAAILHTTLEHYRPLTVCGIRFTWLGVHQLYRVALVASNTYITQPLKRLWVMSSLLMVIAIANTFIKPYKENTANKTAILSYAANICIAVINMGKAFFENFDCKINCSQKLTLLWYFDWCEKILLVYVPVVAFGFWLVRLGFQKCCSKSKRE